MNQIDYSKYEGHGLTGATIEPLNGKYYGTRITNPDGSLMEIWGWNRQCVPSHRELSDWEDEDEPFEICDSHYEDVGDLATATLIADAPDLLAACRERDRMLRRAAEAIAAILEAERFDISPSERDWCIAQAEGWLADYESQIADTSSRVSTDRDGEKTCIWTWSDVDKTGQEDGACVTTSCGHRVEPAPGLQIRCHICGGDIEVKGELRRRWKYVEYETQEARETVDALYNWVCELLGDLPGVEI